MIRSAGNPRAYTAVSEKLELIAATPRAQRVLDVGAADGQYVAAWHDRAHAVVAVDLDLSRIAQLHARFARAAGVSIVRASVERLPFADGSFDVVWASEILEHLTSLRALDELERVGSSEILVTLPSPTGPYRYLDRSHVLRYSLSSLRQELSARDRWRYRLHGLGGCLPAWMALGPVRRAWLAASRDRPALAWTLLIHGKRLSPDPASNGPA